MKTFRSLFLFLTVLLSACASMPAAEPNDEPGPTTAPAMPIFTDRPNTPAVVNPNTPIPTPFFESPYSRDSISPIYFGTFHDFVLLGAISSGQWIQPEYVYGLLYEDEVYDFYFDHEFIGTGTAHVRQPVNFGPPGYCNYLSAEQSVMGGEPPSFALPQGQSAALRPIEDIAVDTPLYTDAVAEWLTLQAIPTPTVNITRILRVDIEGDGVDEVLISASHYLEETGHMVVEGDYSLVLMRKVVGGEVYTTPIVQDIYYGNTPVLEFPRTYSLADVFDLNGDGMLEVIIAGNWWESSGYYVHEIHGINSAQVLKLECGYVVQQP